MRKMLKVLLPVLMVVFFLFSAFCLLRFAAGSLEMFPTPEQQQKTRIASGLGMAGGLIAGCVCAVLMRKFGSRPEEERVCVEEKKTVKEIIIDGKNFSDLEGFYCETEKLLTKDLSWEPGRNLDAFNDLLRGGFGLHEPGEPLKIKWLNYAKSKKDLGDETVLKIIEMILTCEEESGHCCSLELQG